MEYSRYYKSWLITNRGDSGARPNGNVLFWKAYKARISRSVSYLVFCVSQRPRMQFSIKKPGVKTPGLEFNLYGLVCRWFYKTLKTKHDKISAPLKF
jgi:hypothetical protein